MGLALFDWCPGPATKNASVATSIRTYGTHFLSCCVLCW